ncbi:uncharacterized protein LOC111267390 [Varroa jacobsoni]|uniref:BTB domain-containing protein n=1 Tax=Varroa destructor TaxID=109461 RepID=A0A7M7MA91_VARDE|nr:uncharacterized protein LOC111250421 [Varroa destructor]XP_022661390.1 uncharacterized protein LOC111250421 [Varroa destructor]XP_022661391.1 uncharacterized protein LOC111250421 [Varroa destructor]XP_022661392.1 uncharacterized protein LOC111250421 [Varroa destructor]XP_022661393.1 uncharacterized protein LOC111250421 [Varroa destructor]XP_022661394.1 uncharacterized protein LOC111250421 [Varroa destructor]XP_022661395.1 uncharacterized protein LOC111250421 [Varroa destructor]XP_02266139
MRMAGGPGDVLSQDNSIFKNLQSIVQLISDLQRLYEDKDSADIEFVVGKEETRVLAHSLIVKTRCSNYNELKLAYGQRSMPGKLLVLQIADVNVEEFNSVVQYIYTGRINLNAAVVFKVLALALEFGISELKLTCEDHIMNTMKENACVFLSSAFEGRNDRREAFREEAAVFVDKCTTHICEHAADCVKSSAFLRLSKECVIHLVSSDYLGMKEDDVWRAVLAWAKHQANVTSSPHSWTDGERQLVGQALRDVINHVRILLIDKQVYAEEVEPTGLVPLELSLQRYRYAALPDTFQPKEPHLTPRAPAPFFKDSNLLTGKNLAFQQLLNNWFGKPSQMWRRLYLASANSYSAASFHECCDGIAPLFVLVLGSSGQLCGGFTDVPFVRTNGGRAKYSTTDRAFLFSLINLIKRPATRFNIIKKMFAIASHPEFGPIFGAGADLSIANNCNVSMECYSNLPHTYDGEGASSTLLMGGYNFTVADYEVFTVS